MSGEQATRPYHSPLRERRAAETRDLILEAVAALITERGTTEFSMQEVADQAEVSLRTVYRHFPSRQELLDGLARLVDEELAAARTEGELGWQDLTDRSLDQLLATARTVFERFDELEPLSSAMALLSAGGHRTADSHDQRTDVYREVLAEHLAALDEQTAAQTFAVVRHLLSSSTWFALRQEFGLTGREAGEAVTRAVAAIVANARAR